MSVMLTFGLSLATLAYKQQVLASGAIDSQYAFYAADAALECALYADQQQSLFTYNSNPLAPAPIMTCDNAPAISSIVTSHTAAQWVITSRLSFDAGKRCADVTVYKPLSGTTYIFAQGYSVSCAVVGSPAGARFSSRGLSTHYGTAQEDPAPPPPSPPPPVVMAATGGTVTTDGDYKVHRFTSNGTFTVTSAPAGATVEVLVVGGGGGAGSDGSGGAGAGGLCYQAARPVSTTGYPVSVASGGVGHRDNPAAGGSSTFDTIIALGGGAASDASYTGSRNGGSGGGGSNGPGPGSSIQGNSGGATCFGSAGGASDQGDDAGGGGGGAGGPGQPRSAGGAGGVGRQYSITGVPVYYAGGGGGGVVNSTTNLGGAGGGGRGGNQTTGNANGTNYTGGGAGGGADVGQSQNTSRNGGAGVVIVRYKYQ